MSAFPAADDTRDAIDASTLAARYRAVRGRSIALAAPLSAEDAMVQSMPDASPAKWHLAHTTWFFERFVLGARDGYAPVDPQWDYLFNSYYNSVGPMHARPRRGLVSRPSLIEVLEYREEVDARMARRFDAGDLDEAAARVVLLGTHHEQQHQELLLTDIKHALWCNPLGPAYRDDLAHRAGQAAPLRWVARDEAVAETGAEPWPDAVEFAYDNESPRHRVLVAAHALASRPVSNAEYAQFVDDGAYANPALWLSDGWALLQAEGWQRPLYWHEDSVREFTLGGWRARDPHAPVCHLSHYEADAFARWAGARLPTEAEWEQAAQGVAVDGNLADAFALHPQAADDDGAGLRQLFGDVWEWTCSAYTAYPGFRPLPGSLGEYNGKFMSGQVVLRGGSCATPRDHMRASYRNFFPPQARWQFSGLRLARDGA
ncbi:ergothioneine biosynthesis protein EgtB [Luteimonas lutimaris]|uniref:Ergothioneine biosynthesis protein EgtB n=1 Tax=Luteimonas lutimaris TaxID=698645 RepID=A0ABP7M1U7_9GAMM